MVVEVADNDTVVLSSSKIIIVAFWSPVSVAPVVEIILDKIFSLFSSVWSSVPFISIVPVVLPFGIDIVALTF